MVVTTTTGWRAYRRTRRLASVLSTYLDQEATEIERLSVQLNEHGFELQHTWADVAPKLELIAVFLDRPLIAATIPWILRRVAGRPYRRRH